MLLGSTNELALVECGRKLCLGNLNLTILGGKGVGIKCASISSVVYERKMFFSILFFNFSETFNHLVPPSLKVSIWICFFYPLSHFLRLSWYIGRWEKQSKSSHLCLGVGKSTTRRYKRVIKKGKTTLWPHWEVNQPFLTGICCVSSGWTLIPFVYLPAWNWEVAAKEGLSDWFGSAVSAPSAFYFWKIEMVLVSKTPSGKTLGIV